MHLLIVDDDHDSAEALGELLELLVASVQVVLAFDGAEALAAATDGKPIDAIISDIEMPRMDGITAAIRIRRALGDATPLLIAATGDVGISKLSAIRDVFDHVLIKPLRVNELVRLLRTLG